MTSRGSDLADAFDVEAVRRRLEEGNGGYEIVHASPGLEVGVYVLVAPEPDHQQPHEDDELYVVLDGRGHADGRGQGDPAHDRERGVRACGSRASVHGLRGSQRPRRLRAAAGRRGAAPRAEDE